MNKTKYYLFTFLLITIGFQGCITQKKFNRMVDQEIEKALKLERTRVAKEREEAKQTGSRDDNLLDRIMAEREEYKKQLEYAQAKLKASEQMSFEPSEGYKTEIILKEFYYTQKSSHTENIKDLTILSIDEMRYLLNISNLHASKQEAIKYSNFFKGGYDMSIDYINSTNPNDESRITLKNNDCPFETLLRKKISDIKVRYFDENEIWFYRFGKKTKESYFGNFYLLEVFSINFNNDLEIDCNIKYFESFEKRLGRIKKTNIQGKELSHFIKLINQCYE